MVGDVSTNYKSIGHRKLQMTNPPKLGSALLLMLMEIVCHHAKMENGCQFVTIGHTEKLQMTNPPPKFGSALLLMSMEIVCHYAKMEKWLPIGNYWSYRKTPND